MIILNNGQPKANNSEWEQTLQSQAESLVDQFQAWLTEQSKVVSDFSNSQIYMQLINLLKDPATPAQQGIPPLSRGIAQAAYEVISSNLNTNAMTNLREEESPMLPPGITPEQPNTPNPQRQRRPRIEEPMMPVPIQKPKKS